MAQHKKHPKVSRPSHGMYHRCEVGLYGTSCGKIAEMYDQIESRLSTQCHYIDADHSQGLQGIHLQIAKKQISSNRTAWNSYDDLLSCRDADAVIVNGNHYPAAQQILLLDEVKRDSLYRRLDQLTDVIAVVTNGVEIFDFLKEKIKANTEVFEDSSEAFFTWLAEHCSAHQPSLKALVLAGGKSTRMGQDKSQITYHDRPQELHIADICTSLGIEVFISKAHDYPSDAIGKYAVVRDRMISMGPLGAILSAMMTDAKCAWLVLACDLPLLDKNTIAQLIDSRSPSQTATAYRASEEAFPEPLITIYEPRSYGRLLSFLSLGYSCPRKMLINSDIKCITIPDPKAIINANHPTERDDILKTLRP